MGITCLTSKKHGLGTPLRPTETRGKTLSIMTGKSGLYARLLLFFALVCAAVMPFLMCSDAARASPITTQVDNGVRHTVLRRPYTPHSEHHRVLTGPPSRQTGANSETERSGSYKKTLSLIYHHLKPLRLTKGSPSSNNSPDNRQSQAVTTSVTSPTSSYHPLSHNSYPKKASNEEAASPFPQSCDSSDVWDVKEAKKFYITEKVPRNDAPSLVSRTGIYRSTSLPTSRGLYSGYKETNELTSAGARSTSSGIQSSKFFDLASQTAPHAPSISSSSDAAVIKSILRPEKLTPSITDFSQGLHSVSGSETPRHKNIQSYRFKNSRTPFGGHATVQTVTDEGPSDSLMTPHKRRTSEILSRLYSSGKRLQQSQRKDPTKVVRLSDNANNVTRNGAQTDGFTKYQHAAQISPPGKDAIVGSFVPMPHADVPGNSSAGSSKSVESGFSTTTTRGSTHASTLEQVIKNIDGFKRFGDPEPRAMKEPPILSSRVSNERTNSNGYSFEKGKGFKITNMNPPSPKYSFGQREASATVATPERTPTDDSSPAPGTHQDVTSGFKEARPLLPESDADVDSNPDHSPFRTNQRIDGLEAFGTQSLEGAKTLVSEPDESARVQQGFQVGSSQIREPKSSDINTMNQTEPRSEDHIPLLRISSGYLRSAVKLHIQSVPTAEPETPDRTRLVAMKSTLFNYSTSSTVRGKRVKGKAKKPKAFPSFNSTVHGALISRTPRVRPIHHADIVGGTSFNGVRATTQTPITRADKDAFPNTSAATGQKGVDNWTLDSGEAVRSGDDTSRGLADFGENKLAVSREEVNNDMKTSDLFLDSGSGDFDASDVLSTATTKSRGLSEDLLEPEYLWISLGNVFFKSMNLSHKET